MYFRVNMKALLQHTPTEDDISHLLKEFTVDFLLKAFGLLVSELRLQLLLDSSLDRTHFSWLIAYFLKFAVQLELDLQHIMYVCIWCNIVVSCCCFNLHEACG